MSIRIKLIDVDRPDEPLHVDVEWASEALLRVSVPNTIVTFELRREGGDLPFEGALGGRFFVFEPPAAREARKLRR
jgi:hypothetical protein